MNKTLEQLYYGPCKHNPGAGATDVCEKCYWLMLESMYNKSQRNKIPTSPWGILSMFLPSRASLRAAKDYIVRVIETRRHLKQSDKREMEHLEWLRSLWLLTGKKKKTNGAQQRDVPRITIDEMLPGLKVGRKIVCINPEHPDTHPSMSVFMSNSGRVKLHCFSCAKTMDEVDVYAIQHGVSKREAWKYLYIY